MKCILLRFVLLLNFYAQVYSLSLFSNEFTIIYNRGLPEERIAVYRAEVPANWQRKDPAVDNSDTMMPLSEFIIGHGEEEIRVTVHNFPFVSLNQRPSPVSQISRWKQQMSLFNPLKVTTEMISKGGFTGLYLAALEFPIAVLAFSMNMADEHARFLLTASSRSFHHMRADYTIKAVGPHAAITHKKQEIERFSHSFELIDEIPSR